MDINLKELIKLDNTECFNKLEDYCKENNIDTDKTVYRLTVEDVLSVISDNEKIKNAVAEGKISIEDCIYVVENKMEIDWTEYVKIVIEARLL